ncbi:hypothetical protein E3J61_02055 [Candidatus Dependentiae bacterium]|nr:MAG: hypothetical protein E3J61_02055 [Candidatus Dependentiae bacterium]
MKKSLRIITLMFVGALGLTPFHGMARLAPAGPPQPPLKSERHEVLGAVVFAGIIGAAIVAKNLVGRREISETAEALQRVFPTYPPEILRLAAIAKLYSFKNLIHYVAQKSVFRLKNPREVLRTLASDPRVVEAISYATYYKQDYVKETLMNPTRLQMWGLQKA